MLGQVVQNKCVRSRILVTKVRFEPGSNRFELVQEVQELPEPRTEPRVRFSKIPEPEPEPWFGSVRFRFEPRFRTELRQHYSSPVMMSQRNLDWSADFMWLDHDE